MSQLRNPRIKFGTTENSIYLDISENNKLIVKNNDIDIVKFSGITSETTFKIQSTDPSLEIFNYGSNNGYSKISMGVTGKENWNIIAGYEDRTDEDANIHIIRGNKEIMSINTTGIGIGVTNPEYALDVDGTATFRKQVNIQGSLVLGGGLDEDNLSPLIWHISDDGQDYYTNPSNNLGIGTSQPNYKLEVDGDIGISGSININSNGIYDIGTTSNNFNNLFINNINLNGKNISNINNKINLNDNTRINGNLDIEGDLNVYGNAITFDTETIQVEDSMIALATNNIGDIIDSGFYSKYIDSGVTRYSGLVRDSTDNKYKLFTNLEIEPTSIIDINDPSFQYGDLMTNNLDVKNNLNVTGNIYNNGILIENVWNKHNSDIYYNDANVGIGITTPINGKLEISGEYGSVSLLNYSIMDNEGVEVGITNTNSYSIYADGKIAASEFNAISDKRVKNIINERNVNDDINFINNINIYNYEYKDKYNFNENNKIGFIAQEIFKINKNIINKSKRYIPNIFNIYNFIDKNTININNDKIKEFNLNDNIKIEIKLKNKMLKQLNVDILNIVSNNIIINIPNDINIDYNHGVFIYGKLINDFMTIDINQILSMNTNILKYLLDKNNLLENRLQKLENKIYSIKN